MNVNLSINARFWCALLMVFLCIYFVPTADVLALDGEAPSPAPNNPLPHEGQKTAGTISLMTNREFALSFVILVFGLCIIGIEYFILKSIIHQKPEQITQTFIVTLIIVGTLVLISAGYSNDQIGPALGLFGTIAGYLLGKSEGERNRNSKMEDRDDG